MSAMAAIQHSAAVRHPYASPQAAEWAAARHSTRPRHGKCRADMNSEQNLLLGSVEWAVVTKYLFTPGFFLRLEDSGDEVFMDSMSFSDDPACCQFEYWPDLGERIRVRRFPDDGRGQIRVTGKASRLAGLTHGYPTRELGLPAGLGPIELGRVIEHRDRDILVRLEDSDRIGVLSEQTLLYESGRRVHERLTTYEDGEYRKHWPAVGARIQVQRLGVWPDGELRLAGRSMVSAPGWPLHSRADRSWNWSTKYTRVLPPQVVDRVRAVADAVSLRDWGQAEELTSDNRLDWEQADAFMTTYGGGGPTPPCPTSSPRTCSPPHSRTAATGSTACSGPSASAPATSRSPSRSSPTRTPPTV